jgi:hypothetical protein
MLTPLQQPLVLPLVTPCAVSQRAIAAIVNYCYYHGDLQRCCCQNLHYATAVTITLLLPTATRTLQQLLLFLRLVGTACCLHEHTVVLHVY